MKKANGLSVIKSSGIVFLLFCIVGLVLAAESVEQLRGKEISQIKVAGNVSIKSEMILTKVRSREGLAFSPEVVNEDIERVASLDGVEYAYYNTQLQDDKIILTFAVYEKNLAREINLSGNMKIKDRVLLKQLDFVKGDYLDKFIAQTNIDKLKDYYKKKGYTFAEVSLDPNQLEAGKVNYTIIEGPRCKVKKVDYDGNIVIVDKEIKRGLKTTTKKWFFWPNYYNVKTAEEDKIKIEKAYHEKGFINVKVDVVEKYYNDNAASEITFKITEGQVFTVDDILITGNNALGFETLTQKTKLVKGWVYSEEKAKYDSEKILAAYKERGYVDAKVAMNRDFVGQDKVKVVFDAEEGKQFRIGKINVAGNSQTHDKVVRRVLDEYDFQPGEWYNADIAKGDGTGSLEKNVRRETYAESVLITPVVDANDANDVNGTGDKLAADANDSIYKKDVLVSLAEGQTGMILFGAGVGSNDGVVGQIIYEQRNLDISDTPDSLSDFLAGKGYRGAGQKLRIALEPGTEYSRYSISFTEPYLYDKPIQLDTVLSSYTRERESYEEDRLKGYVSFQKRFHNGWYRGIGFRAENVDVGDIDWDAPMEIKDYKGSNSVLGIKLFTGKSTVDDKYNPTKGYIFDCDIEQVTGVETFQVGSASNRWYNTVYEDLAERKTVLATRVSAASIIGDAPPFEKFYGGGTGSIRGFEYRGVSTRGLSTAPGSTRRKDPIGSDWIMTGGSELAVPLGQGEMVSALFFGDAGLIDSGSVRSAVGIGIQIMIPQWFGPVPMRFELAAPVTKEDEDDTQVFSFSVGRLF
jgi:outer membrane protein insertion porin family